MKKTDDKALYDPELTEQLRQTGLMSERAKVECEKQRQKMQELEQDKARVVQDLEEEHRMQRERWETERETERMRIKLDGLLQLEDVRRQLEEVRQQSDHEHERHQRELERKETRSFNDLYHFRLPAD